MTSRPAPRVVLLLPVAVFLRQLEEWFGGFVPWVNQVFGDRLTPEQFLAVNVTGLVIFTVAAVAAVSLPGTAWLAASVATLMGVNGVAHLVGSLVFGSYSPGAVTGLVLFVPLSVVVLRSLARQLPRQVLVGAVLFGLLFHLFATLVALSQTVRPAAGAWSIKVATRVARPPARTDAAEPASPTRSRTRAGSGRALA